ncbi:hypothetical protein [Campylobacter sp.]|uniref:hypothetical protein n=1 Tax=Campylobacter sp. TaxID=205 RepID=UPI0027069BC7|nr:hypothetical protein [Campylobacter sp.]
MIIAGFALVALYYFVIIGVFASLVAVPIELYLQNKKIKNRNFKDFILALNLSYSFRFLVGFLFVIFLYLTFYDVGGYTNMVIFFIIMLPHILLSLKYDSKFNRYAGMKVIKRREKILKAVKDKMQEEVRIRDDEIKAEKFLSRVHKEYKKIYEK